MHSISHRQYPPPERPSVMHQTWSNLLFAHWPCDPALLNRHIPTGLQLDTVDGEAWIGVVPFTMNDVRLRGLPTLPGFHSFCELNVRTYVTHDGRPGVLFFSLDASNGLVVEGARSVYHLPYYHADMSSVENDMWIEYKSTRKDSRGHNASFHARYRPDSDIFFCESGSLEHFLTERYCLYVDLPNGQLFRGEIHHQQWPLQKAAADIFTNRMLDWLDSAITNKPPLLHYARRLDTVEWALVPA